MKRIICKRAIAGLALAAVLSLIAPMPAQASPGGQDGHAWASSDGWAWLSSLWGELRVLARGGGTGARQPAAAVARKGAVSHKIVIQCTSQINPDGRCIADGAGL
jgi:hypothetical protein